MTPRDFSQGNGYSSAALLGDSLRAFEWPKRPSLGPSVGTTRAAFEPVEHRKIAVKDDSRPGEMSCWW